MNVLAILRLYGEESLISTHNQSLVARRLESMKAEVETRVDYHPEHFQQMAGLIFYYDTNDYVYLRITYHEELGAVLGIIRSKYGEYEELLDQEIQLPLHSNYFLKASVRNETVSFYYSLNGDEWELVEESIDISHLSDDDPDYIRFTGTYVGLCAQDLSGQKKHADFNYFIYQEGCSHH